MYIWPVLKRCVFTQFSGILFVYEWWIGYIFTSGLLIWKESSKQCWWSTSPLMSTKRTITSNHWTQNRIVVRFATTTPAATCNQCLSPLNLWVWIPLMAKNVLWHFMPFNLTLQLLFCLSSNSVLSGSYGHYYRVVRFTYKHGDLHDPIISAYHHKSCDLWQMVGVHSVLLFSPQIELTTIISIYSLFYIRSTHAIWC